MGIEALAIDCAKNAQQATIPKRASSVEPAGGPPTPRGRSSMQQGQSRRSLESNERGSPRTASRPLTARETRRSIDKGDVAVAAVTPARTAGRGDTRSMAGDAKSESRFESQVDGRSHAGSVEGGRFIR